jgi:hypothetical protein
MEKIRAFFERTGLLNNEQFDELCKCVSVSVSLPNAYQKNICLMFKYKSIIPINVFKNLYLNINSHKDDLAIKFTNKINIELDEFIDYFKF